jgi:hypothetical protein
MNTESKINIDDLKRDIEEQEGLSQKFINEANNMYYLVVVSICLFIYSLVIGNYILSISFFLIGFMCLRRYNKCIGMAEVHNGIMKFLKMLLIQEQTGEDVFKNIVG